MLRENNTVGPATQGNQTAQTITFPQPAAGTYPGTDTLTATASSTLAVTYTLISGPATLAGSTLTFTGTGTVSVTASQAGNVRYAAAVPVTLTVNVTLAESFITWNPSATKIYTGTTLAGVLDANDSIPATFAYTASLLPSGSPVSVLPSTVLTAGNYDLTAIITPSIVNYAQVSDSLLFQVQNMNVFVANLAGNVLSLYNNGSQQSSATSGGGEGTAVDSSGYVWSINTDESSLSKFTDSGALAGSYPVSGMAHANALAIDGAGTIWVVNSHAGTISAVANSGAALSTPVGNAAGLKGPASINVDTAGSLWIANAGNNTVTEIIGVAAPVTAPISTAVTYSTLATKP